MLAFRSPAAALIAASTLATGCLYYGDQSRDIDRTPRVDTGVGASILMPGQSAPSFPEPGAPGSVTNPSGANPETGGGAQPGGGRLTMIGSSRIDETQHVKVQEEPIFFKYLALPFAVAAAPFVAAKEALQGEPEPGPEVPRVASPQPQAAARPRATSYEEHLIDDLDRELDQRQAGAGPAHSGAAPRSGASRAPSISDELASLQRAPVSPSARVAPPAPPAPETTAPAVGAQGAPRVSGPSEPVADGIVDRNEDGRIDLWIYRQQGEIVRRVLDENYDGAPDSWVDYQDGAPARRRADSNYDGAVDSWTFYRDGQTARHEQDTTGNGFRDRVGFYENGKLVREEQDTLGSGRPDVIVYYDEREQIVRKDEDTDHDGRVDVVSHYQKGRVVRRELMDAAAQATTDAPRATP
jgi:hypothetical protein